MIHHPVGLLMSLDLTLYPDSEIVLAPTDYTSERAFRLLVGNFTRQGFIDLAENLLQVMKNPPTSNYGDLLLLVHQAAGEPWSEHFQHMVSIAQLGLTQTALSVATRFEQVLDVTFNHYAASHPAFSQHFINEVVAGLPPKKLCRLLTKGLRPTTDPAHVPGDHVEISTALAESIRLAIQTAYPEGTYFEKRLSAADNRAVYRHMGWREAMEHMKASDHESQLAEELGL